MSFPGTVINILEHYIYVSIRVMYSISETIFLKNI